MMMIAQFVEWCTDNHPVALAFTILVVFFVCIFAVSNNTMVAPYQTIRNIDKMTGKQFEQYLVDCFTYQGWNVNTTSQSHDYGADLIMGKGRKKVVVQAKRSCRTVGVAAIQEVVAAKAYYTCNEAWVVTNHHFTASAIKLAEANRVKLIDRDFF